MCWRFCADMELRQVWSYKFTVLIIADFQQRKSCLIIFVCVCDSPVQPPLWSGSGGVRWSRVWKERSARRCRIIRAGCVPPGTRSKPPGWELRPAHTHTQSLSLPLTHPYKSQTLLVIYFQSLNMSHNFFNSLMCLCACVCMLLKCSVYKYQKELSMSVSAVKVREAMWYIYVAQ